MLRWRKGLSGGKPVAEGVPGCHLHLHLLWRTAGMILAGMFSTQYDIYVTSMCVTPPIRARDARTARDQAPVLTPACCSLLDMETHYTKWWVEGFDFNFLSRVLTLTLFFFKFSPRISIAQSSVSDPTCWPMSLWTLGSKGIHHLTPASLPHCTVSLSN